MVPAVKAVEYFATRCIPAGRCLLHISPDDPNLAWCHQGVQSRSKANMTGPNDIPSRLTSDLMTSRPQALSQSATRSGYAESRLTDTPPTPLRTHIRKSDEEQQGPSEGDNMDFYQLSRTLFTDEDFTKAAGVKMDDESAKTLNKLVGCLTKEGKKSKAYRIVLDAMAIIHKNLHQQQQQQAAVATGTKAAQW